VQRGVAGDMQAERQAGQRWTGSASGIKARQWWQSGGNKMSRSNLNIMLHHRLPSCDRATQHSKATPLSPPLSEGKP
jgi:hypothetical protein